MMGLTKGLLDLNLRWQESEVPVSLVFDLRPESMPPPGHMQIIVTSSDRSAIAEHPLERLCTSLATLDRSFHSERIRWEFQRYRFNLGCDVPGFEKLRFAD
jgi:hypothetical protein